MLRFFAGLNADIGTCPLLVCLTRPNARYRRKMKIKSKNLKSITKISHLGYLHPWAGPSTCSIRNLKHPGYVAIHCASGVPRKYSCPLYWHILRNKGHHLEALHDWLRHLWPQNLIWVKLSPHTLLSSWETKPLAESSLFLLFLSSLCERRLVGSEPGNT